jgi:hypothetical protein
MKKIHDMNGKLLQRGDVIDIHQTVNGQNLFAILNLQPLDIRYYPDLKREYEYDKEQLLAPDFLTGETEFEIVDNIISKLFELL